LAISEAFVLMLFLIATRVSATRGDTRPVHQGSLSL
jgi:hypothetical protein